MKSKYDPSDAPFDLFDIATELKALGYLLETQGPKANQMAGEELDEISHGIGRIVYRLARKVRNIGHELDERAVISVKKPKGSSDPLLAQEEGHPGGINRRNPSQ